MWSDLRSNVSTPSTFLDPKLLTALTATRDGSNASTNTKRKRDTEAAAEPDAVAEVSAATCDSAGDAQPAQVPEKQRLGCEGTFAGDSITARRSSPSASMEEVRAAAAGAIRAMSRHVSQVDFEAHGGDALVRHDADGEQLAGAAVRTVAADDQSATAANCL